MNNIKYRVFNELTEEMVENTLILVSIVYQGLGEFFSFSVL